LLHVEDPAQRGCVSPLSFFLRADTHRAVEDEDVLFDGVKLVAVGDLRLISFPEKADLENQLYLLKLTLTKLWFVG
jgi:hypothetical protein